MKKLIFVAIACACISSPAWAGVVGLHNTGEAGVGVADPHYTLTSVPSGSTIAYGTAKHSAWIAAPTGSNWIGPTAYNVTDPMGWYTYELDFTIDDVNPAGVVITGNWSVDNSGEIWLNGAFTGIAKGNTVTDTQEYKSIESFTIDSGFQAGDNTLEFRVYNFAGTSGNPTALVVSDLAATVTPIPAPGAILLGSLGTGLVGWMRRRRTV